MTKPKIALQLWSIQEDCKTDLFEALKTVKQNGYDGVEFAGYHGHSAAQIKEMLEQLDLAVAASISRLKHCKIVLKKPSLLKKRLAINGSSFRMPVLILWKNGKPLLRS